MSGSNEDQKDLDKPDGVNVSCPWVPFYRDREF